jgi:hypothetical protein
MPSRYRCTLTDEDGEPETVEAFGVSEIKSRDIHAKKPLADYSRDSAI